MTEPSKEAREAAKRAWEMYSRSGVAAIIQSYGDARVAEVVAWLRAEANKGAEYGIAADKGTTKRAAYGGGVLALDRAADAIERGDHLTRAAHNPAEQGDGK